MPEFDDYSDDLLASVKRLQDLETQNQTQEGQAAANRELQSFTPARLAQIAVNSTADRAPNEMGEIERMLSTGDLLGLQARLGHAKANQLNQAYLEAWKQSEFERNQVRSGVTKVTDTTAGIARGVGNSTLGFLDAAWNLNDQLNESLGNFVYGKEQMDKLRQEIKAVSPNTIASADEAAAKRALSAKEVDDNVFQPLLSEHVKAQEKRVAALNAKDEEIHAAEADAKAAANSEDFVSVLSAWGGRVAKDAYTGGKNTVTNPTMAVQGTADAAASMIVAGGMAKGLGMLGESVIKAKAAQILETQLAAGVEKKVADEAVKAFLDKVGMAQAGAVTGATEAQGAYQQQMLEVLGKKPDDLAKTSEDFRGKVAELMAANPALTKDAAQLQAQYWLANKTAFMSAAGTGIFSALVGAALPEGVANTFSPKSTARTVYGAFLKDAAKEGVEEFLQGAGGALVQNETNRQFVDKNVDTLDSVGTQAGQGGVLGVLSSGMLKGPSTAAQTLGLAGRGAVDLVNQVSAKRTAAAEADSQGSIENLTKAADSLDPVKVGEQVVSALAQDQATLKSVAPVINELTESVRVDKLPSSYADVELPASEKGVFTDGQSRVQAINNAARLFSAETNPENKAKLAVFLSDLMEPVRRFRETSSELDVVSGNAAVMDAIGPYQQVLASIERLPEVKRALAEMTQTFEAKLGSSETQSPQVIAAFATIDPGLGGKVAAKTVERMLAHADSQTMSQTQRAALQGSLALLRAREAVSKNSSASSKLIDQHLGKNREQVGEEVTVAQDAMALETGKYSARQHADRIIRAMMAGNTDLARESLKDLGLFARHQVNKVQALKRSLEQGGKPQAYQQLVVDPKTKKRSWASSETNPNSKYKHAFVNTKSADSIAHAQEVDAESHLLYELHKGLTEAYPQLGVKPVQQDRLPKNLRKAESTPATKQQPKPVEVIKIEKPKAVAPSTKASKSEVSVRESTPKAQPKVEKNEVKQPKNEVKTESKPKTALERLRERVPKLTVRDRATILGTDSLSGLRTRAAWDESPRSPGSQVLIITSAAAKAVNDHTKGGHDTTNELLRVMGTAVGKIDPKAARSGTNFLIELKPGMDPVEILSQVRKSLPDSKFELVSGVGADTDAAFSALDKNSDSMREAGILPGRGETAADLSNLDKMVFAKGKAQQRLSQQTVDRVKKMTDDEFHKEGFEDKVVPGVMNKNGWDHTERKAWVVSIDLKRLKEWNDRLGKEFGDKLLKAFSIAARDLNGSDFDFSHLSGDEYAAQHDSKEALAEWVAKLEKALQDVGIPATYRGEEIEVTPQFRSGIGAKTYGEADRVLNAAKRAEQAAAQKSVDGRTAGPVGEGSGVQVNAEAPRADVQGPDARVEGRGPVSGPDVATDEGNRREEVAPKSVAEVFPKLHEVPGKVRNFFKQAFKFKQDSTRLLGKTDSMETVRQALLTPEAIKEFVGTEVRWTEEVAGSYYHLLDPSKGPAANVMAALQKNLEQFLNSNYSKSEGKTFADIMRDGSLTEPTMMLKGKVLNLVEPTADGKSFRYNPELLQQAVMAAFQWHITASQRQGPMKEDEILKELGLESLDGAKHLLPRLMQGESLIDSKIPLASHIRRFWGVQGDKAQSTGFTDAIPEAMAAEILRVMQQLNLVSVDSIEFATHPSMGLLEKAQYTKLNEEEFKKLTGFQQVDRYLVKDWGKDSPLYAHPSLLEEVVVVEPERTSFYADAEVPVIKHQLSNRNVATSRESNQAREVMQKQPFYLNMPMVNVLLKMSEKTLTELFGHDLPESDADQKSKFNKNDLDARVSKNLSLTGSLRELQKMVQEMESIAPGKAHELAKKFQYAVSSNNRIMMLGAHNPQASKLMRESLMATWSTLDLSNKTGDHYRFFMLALAQALGQKIHRNTLDANVEWSNKAISEGGLLAPAIKVLSDHLGKKDAAFPVKALKKALEGTKVEVTPISVMALIEVARMQQPGTDLKAFRTPLYLEADGMTNGPFNSMGLLTVGEFTPDWVENIRRGGLNIGPEPTTADKLLKGGDLYKASMVKAQGLVSAQLAGIKRQGDLGGKQVASVSNALFTAMSALFKDDVKWTSDESGDVLELDRGLGKNPITQLVYGAGSSGIAAGIMSKLLKAVYEKMSATAQGEPMDRRLVQALAVIAAYQVRESRTGKFFIADQVQAEAILSRMTKPQEFTFLPEETERIKENLVHLLVKPMREGVEQVLGETVRDSSKLLVKATQLQATAARIMYFKAIQAKVAEKVQAKIKAGLDEKKAKSEASSEFLSQTELNQIWDETVGIMPMVSADGQNFLIAKKSLLDFWENREDKKTGKTKLVKQALYEYSRALDDSGRTPPMVDAIDSPGVAAIPYVTIGMGDARMVREIFQKAFDGSLQVFDGINVPVNKITEYGSRINEAALKAWQANIFKSMSESFRKFATDKRITEALLKDPEFAKLLEQATKSKDPAHAMLLDVQAQLDEYALQMQARINTLKKFAVSMDQMAGTYQPFVSEGRSLPEGASERDIADALNAEYEAELEKLRNPEKVKPEAKTPAGDPLPQSLFSKLKRRHESGAWVFTKSAIARDLVKTLKGSLTQNEQELLGEILRSGSLDDTKIVVGTREEVAAYQEAKNLDSLARLTEANPTKTVHGYYAADEKTIYLVDPKIETLVHELVHAATFAAVESHYAGLPLGPNAEQVKAAVTRLEGLMEMFLTTDLGVENVDLIQAVESSRRAIREHLRNESPSAFEKAAALNEFMAWTLANRELAKDLSTLEVESGPRITTLLKSAYNAIKKLIWGRKTAPSFGPDVLSQIRFNTAIIAREAGNLETQVRDVALMHAELNGEDPESPSRLSQVREALARKVARHLNQSYSTAWLEKLGASGLLKQEHAQALALRNTAADLFKMDQEEQSVFEMMVLALSTQADINPHAMIEAQRVFSHFLDGLKQSDLLADPLTTDQDLLDEAKRKFEFISGHSQRLNGEEIRDSSKRSALLPVFMALGNTSEEFRKLLGSKDLKAKDSQKVEGLDSLIERVGSDALDKLESVLSGTDHPENVRVAIDQLTQGMTKSVLQSQTRVEQSLEAVGKFNFGLNGKLRDMMQRLGSKAGQKGDKLRKSDSKFEQKLGSAMQAVSFLASEKDAAVISETVVDQNDRHPEIGGFLRELMNDMIGRIESQADIYDMVKKVRAFVSQSRQAYRDNVPRIIEATFGANKPTAEQWSTLHRVLGRWDVASLTEGRTAEKVLALASDKKLVQAEIEKLSAELSSASSPKQAARYQAKIDQYVKFVQGEPRGTNLLRNAYAISELLGEGRSEKTWVPPTEKTVRAIDQLITLKLLDQAPAADRATLEALAKNEPEGMKYTLNYLKGQRATELQKVQSGPARFNHYKGAMPVDRSESGHIVVASDEDHVRMLQMGYEWKGAYKGSTLEGRGASKSYYYSADGGVKTTFSQGIAQNVQQTAYGVNANTGYSTDLNAGVISDAATVKALADRMTLGREAAGTETLSPVYGPSGEVIAFERSMDPSQMKRLERPQHLAKMIGQWRGRQQEELYAAQMNEQLVNKLHEMYAKDVSDSAGNQERYVDLFDSKSLDPVVRDAVSIFPHELRDYAKAKFGGHFYVRRNLLNQTIGYREASVGDLFTGNTRHSKQVQEAFKSAAITAFGIDAYRTLVNLEKNWMAVTASMRTNIVVRSLTVSFANFVSGVYQLRARGVPLIKALKNVPAKVAEIEEYSKTMARKIELEARRFAENDITESRRIDAQLQALDDGLKRLSIWPLIEAGEFSTIADVGQTAADLDVSPKTLVDRLSAAVDKLPPGLRDAARQGYMARDTAVFQTLQKTVQYSDFIMKAIYFDHMRNKEKATQKQALARVTEEFNNYDMPRGRTRGYLENMGLAWFLNYKIRAAKIGLSMLRNNPLDVLLFSIMPHPFQGGIPVTDNIFARMLDGSLIRAFGPGMVFRPISLNPWYNLISE